MQQAHWLLHWTDTGKKEVTLIHHPFIPSVDRARPVLIRLDAKQKWAIHPAWDNIFISSRSIDRSAAIFFSSSGRGYHASLTVKQAIRMIGRDEMRRDGDREGGIRIDRSPVDLFLLSPVTHYLRARSIGCNPSAANRCFFHMHACQLAFARSLSRCVGT